jgi:succinate dehydrogenase / fumarate reductase iron-sulfur subunit
MLGISMTATFRIQRYNPEQDAKPYFKDYTLDDLDGTFRVLDALHEIKWKIDGTLTFRRSCAHGMCGSDGMRINGRNALACAVLMKDINVSKPIVIEPLPYLPIIKDLTVDQSDFFKKYEMTKPWLITQSAAPEMERLQSHEDAELLMESTKCIMCACCTTSCPSLWANENYLGPAAILKGFRFAFDTRDEGPEEHLLAVDSADGVWRCHTIFNCVEACPKDINITWHISQVKKKLVQMEL